MEKLNTIPNIIRDFTVPSKPLFWTRLVVYAELCADLVNKQGKDIGFEVINYDFCELLKLPNDGYLTENINSICDSIERAKNKGL